MYTTLWAKYLPILKILIKRAATAEQNFDLNKTDFEKAGVARKAGYKFDIQFSEGRVNNVISSSPLAKDLAQVLLEDESIKELFRQNDYSILMTPKFKLNIKFFSKQRAETELVQDDSSQESGS